MLILAHWTVTGGSDLVGLLGPTDSTWFHLMIWGGTTNVQDDDGFVAISSTATLAAGTTDWWWIGLDWPSGTALERMHWRDHTTSGSWTHTPSTGNNGGNAAGPGSTGRFHIGWGADNTTGTRDIAVVAVWPGIRFADADYGSWSRTSDLWNHPAGQPSTLVECTSTTLVDIGANPCTYSSANSSGTTLVGADPPNWTFDGRGGGAVYTPHRMPLGV
jgi:hypothetical protein